MAKRVVLAYSGGLDTSVAVRWMTEELGVEVIALAADLGQGGDFEQIKARAMAAGAVDAVVVDVREEYANDFVAPALKANAKYEGKYPLISSLSRPVIVKHLVAAARDFNADAIAHGCTGKGNDQVRFEVSTRALNPDLEVIAPVRLWGLTREDSIEYAARWNIPITVTKASPYSVDQNLWGRTVECGILEDPWAQPPEEVYELTTPTATDPTEIIIRFEQGLPVAIDGRRLPFHELIREVDRIVGSYGWGRIDMVENRRVGIKSREIYECPGALALLMAHADLEDLTLERDLAHEKARLESRYAELVYDGFWYSPLKQALDAFVDASQTYVSGDVRLLCEVPGRCIVAGRRSEVGLYDYTLRPPRRRPRAGRRTHDAVARALRGRTAGRGAAGLHRQPSLRPASRLRRSGRLPGPRSGPGPGRDPCRGRRGCLAGRPRPGRGGAAGRQLRVGAR
jgi:argininosuccinate synthase